MNFENCEDKSFISFDGDKINFSTSSVGTCLKLKSSVEDDMPVNLDSSSSQEAGNYFSSVLIKCEEPELSDSSNTEMDSKPQILNTVNTNEQSALVVNIKPEPFEFGSCVKQEFVSNQETGPIDVAIKYEKTEMSCSNTLFFSEEAKNTSEQFDFNASNGNTTVKCDPLATETYVKQENEVYVTPSFSTFRNGDSIGIDRNSGDDRSVSVNEKQSQLKCDVCNKTFTRRSGLKNHKRTHTGEKPYQCDVCSKNFTRSWYLNDHKRIHTGEKPYQCDTCDKCFIKHESLKVHRRLHTGEKPYRCDICDKTFSRTIYLNLHKNTHTGEKPYRCDICEKYFTRQDSLIVHRRLHSAEKPFPCDICKKGFSRSSLLIRHKRTHTGERPYQCDICRNCFSTSSLLIIHKRIHTGEKPYQCDICNIGFTQSYSLKIHKRKHTGERPYKCDVCDQTFIYSSDLRKHKLRHN